MALLVTVEDVRAIINTSLSDEAVTVMIQTADNLVQEELKPKMIYTPDRLRLIELWLSAHFIASSDISGQITTERAGGGGRDGDEITYSGKFGDMLSSNRYGQQVLLLDSSGILASITEGKGTAEFHVFGPCRSGITRRWNYNW